MRWYGDNSELNGIWNSAIPDILLLGGIAVDSQAEKIIRQQVREVKAQYDGKADFPIKWNFRDLRKWYERANRMPLYEKLLADSKQWRRQLIEKTQASQFTIVVSLIHFHSTDTAKIKENRENVSQYCFAGALMRLGLHSSDLKASYYEVMLDWPDGGAAQIFHQEYRSAYHEGRCHDSPEVKYHCGPLSRLNFADSVGFTKMEESQLLQFSDIIVGITREFVDFCLEKRAEQDFGVQLMKPLIPKFRGHPGRIIGRGISVAPTDGRLSKKLFDGMAKLRE